MPLPPSRGPCLRSVGCIRTAGASLSACTKGHRNSSFSGSGFQTLARTGITWEDVCKNLRAWASFCRVYFWGGVVLWSPGTCIFQNFSHIDAGRLTPRFEKQCFKVWNCYGKSQSFLEWQLSKAKDTMKSHLKGDRFECQCSGWLMREPCRILHVSLFYPIASGRGRLDYCTSVEKAIGSFIP